MAEYQARMLFLDSILSGYYDRLKFILKIRKMTTHHKINTKLNKFLSQIHKQSMRVAKEHNQYEIKKHKNSTSAPLEENKGLLDIYGDRFFIQTQSKMLTKMLLKKITNNCNTIHEVSMDPCSGTQIEPKECLNVPIEIFSCDPSRSRSDLTALCITNTLSKMCDKAPEDGKFNFNIKENLLAFGGAFILFIMSYCLLVYFIKIRPSEEQEEKAEPQADEENSYIPLPGNGPSGP